MVKVPCSITQLFFFTSCFYHKRETEWEWERERAKWFSLLLYTTLKKNNHPSLSCWFVISKHVATFISPSQYICCGDWWALTMARLQPVPSQQLCKYWEFLCLGWREGEAMHPSLKHFTLCSAVQICHFPLINLSLSCVIWRYIKWDGFLHSQKWKQPRRMSKKQRMVTLCLPEREIERQTENPRRENWIIRRNSW